MSRPALAAAAAAAALALSSCGGDDEPAPPSEPPAELLREAVANPAQSGEARVGLDAVLEGDSLLSGPAALALAGPFAQDPGGGLPSFDLAMDAEVAGFGVDGALVSTGDDAFVVFFGENYRVGVERTAELEQRLPAGGLGLRIDEWLRDPRYAGVEEVGGSDAVRIEGTLDPAALARDLGATAEAVGAPALVRELAAGAGSGPAEVWVALSDHTIRRLRVQFPFEVPIARRAGAGGIAGGVVSLEAEISAVGAEVAVEPPPGGGFQPIEDLIGRLQSLAGLAF